MSLAPRRRAGEFVFVAVMLEQAAGLPAEALIREDEATTAVLRREDAEAAVERADEALAALGG